MNQDDDPGASSSTPATESTSEEIACTSISHLIAINEAYREVVESSIILVEEKMRENVEKQRLLREELRRMSQVDISKKKVPVNLYMPPYFKDENGMCPPMSAEARAKIEKKWFDPLMKEEKKWTPAEIKLLREAVRDSIISNTLQPICAKRDILTSKLRNTDVNTTQAERMQWTSELEEVIRKIEYIRAKNDSDVLTQTTDYSVVAWNEIANVDFKGTRTEWAVRSKWMNELNPKWNRGPWTGDEINRLKDLRESPTFVSWPMLAISLGTRRNAFQCFEKYKTEVAQHSREWTSEEDQKLITLTNLLSINGCIQWDKVAQFMPGRTRQQCRSRFSHTLDTSVKHGRWTDQEDLLLMCSVSRLGAKDWAKVAQAVPGRNDSQCRERWCNVLNRPSNITERFTLAEDEQLLYAVKLFGKGNWSKCATLLPRKTGRQLRRRYIQLIAAKLKMVAGFCKASEAMDGGLRDNNTQDLEEVPPANKSHVNRVVQKTFNKHPEKFIDDSADKLMERINSEATAKRCKSYMASVDWPIIEQNLREIVEKHRSGQDAEIRANEVLKLLNITDIDVRYMIQQSHGRETYNRARLLNQSVDQIGSRVRPIDIKMDMAISTSFHDSVPEDERQMSLVEALCVTVRKHDAYQWGKVYWQKYQHCAAKDAKHFVKDIILTKAKEVATCRLNETPIPAKSTLAPTSASVAMLEMVKRTRGALNQMASKHFYPLDVALNEQKEFREEDREKIDDSTRLNIQLSKEVTSSQEFALLQARMRAILLEPYRLQIARESDEEEGKRLQREMQMEERTVEDELVGDSVLQEEPAEDTTPASIKIFTELGIPINVDGIMPEEDLALANKRKIHEVIDEVTGTIRAQLEEQRKRPKSPSSSSIAGSENVDRVIIDDSFDDGSISGNEEPEQDGEPEELMLLDDN